MEYETQERKFISDEGLFSHVNNARNFHTNLTKYVNTKFTSDILNIDD